MRREFRVKIVVEGDLKSGWMAEVNLEDLDITIISKDHSTLFDTIETALLDAASDIEARVSE